MSHCHVDDEMPGDRMDQSQRHVLCALIHDPFPWTVAELQRNMGPEGWGAEDVITDLDAAGLVHRFIVRRLADEGGAERTDEIVIPTRAARYLDELQGQSI